MKKRKSRKGIYFCIVLLTLIITFYFVFNQLQINKLPKRVCWIEEHIIRLDVKTETFCMMWKHINGTHEELCSDHTGYSYFPRDTPIICEDGVTIYSSLGEVSSKKLRVCLYKTTEEKCEIR